MANPRLHIVVAVCKNGGIGINGKIPWHLKKDMEIFKKLTSETQDSTKQNAVIMGRKTWLSIPQKFRPLKNRVNIILSNSITDAPDGAYVVKNFKEAIELATSTQLKNKVELIHVIGGSSVYKEAMESNYDCRVYLTKVDADFKCDTFLSDMDEKMFKRVKNPANIPDDVQTENYISFTFEVYDKISQ